MTSFKQKMYQLTIIYERLARKSGVKICFNTEVTDDFVHQYAPDAPIIVVGFGLIIPAIESVDKDKVVPVN